MSGSTVTGHKVDANLSLTTVPQMGLVSLINFNPHPKSYDLMSKNIGSQVIYKQLQGC